MSNDYLRYMNVTSATISSWVTRKHSNDYLSCFASHNIFLGGIFCRRLEDILDAFADKASKPRLYLTDKMQIALGKL